MALQATDLRQAWERLPACFKLQHHKTVVSSNLRVWASMRRGEAWVVKISVVVVMAIKEIVMVHKMVAEEDKVWDSTTEEIWEEEEDE